MTVPSVPSMMTGTSARAPSSRSGIARAPGPPEGAPQDRGMAVAPAELGGETADPARIHQRGIGRGDLLGQDHRAAAQARIGDGWLLQQIANEPRADHPD